MRLLKKTSGRFRDKGQRLLFCKGVASHTAQERPLVLRIEKAEAPQATSLSGACQKKKRESLQRL